MKTFQNEEIQIEAYDKILEIRSVWDGRLLFKLLVDEAEELGEAFREVEKEHFYKDLEKFHERERRRPEEWKKLFETDLTALRKVYDDIQKEMAQFRIKNIKFSFEIQRLIRTLKNRKLKAFIIAHSYVAWYEWTKQFLFKIYKAKFGKGPKNDKELIRFLNSYPSLGILNTEEWGIKANQIRNCVTHERFYYDYKRSELVLIVNGKEKRIRLRKVEWRLMSISHTYSELIRFLIEKVERVKYRQKIEFLT